MLAFITSLRHPDNAKDYGHIEELLRGSLASIEAQSSDEYVAIVVGNRSPSFALPPRVHFVEVDFGPPQPARGRHAGRDDFVRDKGSKIGIGLVAARQFAPENVVFFDADDFLHRNLTKFVSAHPEINGWVIEDGWIYSRARNGYAKQNEFNRTCGTCYVLPYDLFQISPDLHVGSTQREVVESFGELLPNIMGAHRNATQWLGERGVVLERVPFRAAVYHVDTGENHSGKELPGVVRPWRSMLAEEFAIASSKPPGRTLASCFGPRAFRQSVQHSVRRLAFVRRRAVQW